MTDTAPVIPRRFHRLLDAFDVPDWEETTPEHIAAGSPPRQRDFRHANGQTLTLWARESSDRFLTWCATLHRDSDNAEAFSPEDGRLVTVGQAIDPRGLGCDLPNLGAFLCRQLSQAAEARRLRARHQLLLMIHALVPSPRGIWSCNPHGVSGESDGESTWIALPSTQTGNGPSMTESGAQALRDLGFSRNMHAPAGLNSLLVPLCISMKDPLRPMIRNVHSLDIDLGQSAHERMARLHRAREAVSA